MQAEQSHSEDVKPGNQRVMESNHHHFENVVAFFRIHEIDEIFVGKIHPLRLHCEMKQVINNKYEHDNSAHQHRARSIGGTNRLPCAVSDWPGCFVLSGKFHGGPNVQNQHQQQKNASGPDDLWIGLEKMAVPIDGFGAQENLKIAREVADDKQEHHKTGHGHYVFF